MRKGGILAQAFVDDLLPAERTPQPWAVVPATEVAEDQSVVLWRRPFPGGSELRVEMTMQ